MQLFRGMIEGLKDILSEHSLMVSFISLAINFLANFQEPIIWLLTSAVLTITLLVKIEEYRKYLRERRKDDDS